MQEVGPSWIVRPQNGHVLRLDVTLGRTLVVRIHHQAGAFLCAVWMFSQWLRDFFPGSRSCSQSLKTCREWVRLISDFKLAVSVNRSMNGCLSLCIGHATGCRPVQGVPGLLPHGSWDKLKPAANFNYISRRK